MRLQDSRDPFQHQPADEMDGDLQDISFDNYRLTKTSYLACNIESVLDGVVN